MLRQRIITALIMIAIVLVALYLLPSFVLLLIFGALGLLVAVEWSRFVGIDSEPVIQLPVIGAMSRDAVIFVAAVALGMLTMLAFRANPLWVLIPAVSWWALTTGEMLSGTRVLGRPLGGCVLAWISLVSSFLVVAYLLQFGAAGRWLLLCLFIVIWGADSGAYFAGKQFGQHKLAPELSPGKTVEGVAGGIGVAAVFALITGPILFDGAGVLAWILVCVVTALVSVAGDLAQSREKRAQGVKDGGGLLPGHGGLSDRVDSFIAGACVFGLGLNLPGLG